MNNHIGAKKFSIGIIQSKINLKEKINILFLATNDLSKKYYHNLSLKYSRKENIGLNGFLR